MLEGCGADGGRGGHADGESSCGEHAGSVGLKKVSKELSGGAVDSKPHGQERFCNDGVSGTGECAVIMVVGILERVLRVTRDLKATHDLETFHVAETGPGGQVGWWPKTKKRFLWSGERRLFFGFFPSRFTGNGVRRVVVEDERH